MKLLAFTLLLIAALGLLVYTNPKMDAYDQFIEQRIHAETRKAKDPLAGMIGSFFGGFAAQVMTQQTRREDYIFFSTYDTAIGDKHWRAIGILNHFYPTDDQDFKKQPAR